MDVRIRNPEVMTPSQAPWSKRHPTIISRNHASMANMLTNARPVIACADTGGSGSPNENVAGPETISATYSFFAITPFEILDLFHAMHSHPVGYREFL